MKICTYNNINKWQQTTLEHTYAVIYYYCVNHWKHKFTSQQHLVFYQNDFTHYFKEAMFSHWTMSVCSRWQFKSRSNEDNYSLPYQIMGIVRPLLSAYSMKLSFQHFFKFRGCTFWKLWHHMSPSEYKYKSGTIKKNLVKIKAMDGMCQILSVEVSMVLSSPPIKYNMVSQDHNLNTQCHENPKSYNTWHVNNLLC